MFSLSAVQTSPFNFIWPTEWIGSIVFITSAFFPIIEYTFVFVFLTSTNFFTNGFVAKINIKNGATFSLVNNGKVNIYDSSSGSAFSSPDTS